MNEVLEYLELVEKIKEHDLPLKVEVESTKIVVSEVDAISYHSFDTVAHASAFVDGYDNAYRLLGIRIDTLKYNIDALKREEKNKGNLSPVSKPIDELVEEVVKSLPRFTSCKLEAFVHNPAKYGFIIINSTVYEYTCDEDDGQELMQYLNIGVSTDGSVKLVSHPSTLAPPNMMVENEVVSMMKETKR